MLAAKKKQEKLESPEELTANWFVYMLQCADGSIYTGITNNIELRLAKHNSGKGAKYTRARLPVKLKATWIHPNKSEASKAEHALKKLQRDQKLRLIAGQS